jgi:glycosyltransferase involved in cell wall biosynthesis
MSTGSPLRVLHILPSMHGYGAERQIMQLLPQLQSSAFVTGLATVYTPSEEQRRSATFPVVDASRNGRRDFTFIGRLVDRIRSFDPDIVHTHTHVGKYWGRFAAVAAGVRAIVHTEHNPCDPRRSALDRIAGRALNPYTDRCITFFPEQRDELARIDGIGAEKFSVIPNGLEFDQMVRPDRQKARNSLALGDRSFAILLIGRMEYQKNHELAIHALAAIPERERRGIELFFAGSGELEPRLKNLARSLGVFQQIQFLGYRSDVPNLLAASDLLLMTSHFEGMPLALLEGMHAGVPIVTTPWTGSRTMLGAGEYGRIADGWAPAQIAAEIAAIRIEENNNAGAVEAAQRYVSERFTLRRMVEEHERLYTDLSCEERSVA